MATIVFTLLMVLEPGASARPALPAPTIDWPDFFASVSTRGVVFSDRLKSLEGRRVRLRGYSVSRPDSADGILLTRIPYVASDPHDGEDELDIPFDAVGVLWRKGLAIPPVPERPTIEGTLVLGNQSVTGQTVAILLRDAEPVVLPARR